MKRTLLALTLLAALPFAASAAEGVSYNYVQGGYAATNNNDGEVDADGFGIDGSVAVHKNVHIFGGTPRRNWTRSTSTSTSGVWASATTTS